VEVAVAYSHESDPGRWLREPSETFILTARIEFSAEECWLLNTHNLYHHVVFDRTPPWYFSALREAERQQESAERDGLTFVWPYYLPLSIPDEWIVTAARLLENPFYIVTFNTASERAEFEPRLMAALWEFKGFLERCGSRPSVVYRRF